MELSAFDVALQAVWAQVGKLIGAALFAFGVLSLWDLVKVKWKP